MNTTEDEDIKLQRASASLLSDLQALLDRVLWKLKVENSGYGQIHRRVREADLDRVISLVAFLSSFISPLLNDFSGWTVPRGSTVARLANEESHSSVSCCVFEIYPNFSSTPAEEEAYSLIACCLQNFESSLQGPRREGHCWLPEQWTSLSRANSYWVWKRRELSNPGTRRSIPKDSSLGGEICTSSMAVTPDASPISSRINLRSSAVAGDLQ